MGEFNRRGVGRRRGEFVGWQGARLVGEAESRGCGDFADTGSPFK